MKRIMIIGCLLLIFVSACKKDNPPADQPTNVTVLDYLPLAVGNYWIYETFFCDSSETNCISQSIDTTRVTKDTVINGNKYYKLEGNYELFTDPVIVRDSGDYLVDQNGEILFTCSDSTQIFNDQAVCGQNNDTIFYWYTKLCKPTGPISVGSGTYDCLDFRTLLYRQQDDFQIKHQAHQYYAKQVGLFKQTSLFVVSLHEYKRELIGYSLVNR